jgi:hypothetical protein
VPSLFRNSLQHDDIISSIYPGRRCQRVPGERRTRAVRSYMHQHSRKLQMHLPGRLYLASGRPRVQDIPFRPGCAIDHCCLSVTASSFQRPGFGQLFSSNNCPQFPVLLGCPTGQSAVEVTSPFGAPVRIANPRLLNSNQLASALVTVTSVGRTLSLVSMALWFMVLASVHLFACCLVIHVVR